MLAPGPANGALELSVGPKVFRAGSLGQDMAGADARAFPSVLRPIRRLSSSLPQRDETQKGR